MTSQKRFCFVAEESDRAAAGGVFRNAKENGEIKVVFYREVETYFSQEEDVYLCCGDTSEYDEEPLVYRGISDFSSGGTILRGHTSQEYGSADKLREIDFENVVTLHARLVVENYQPEADEQPENDIAPLRSAMPPRIEVAGNN